MKNSKPQKPLKNPVVVTANLVLKGQTVYLTKDTTWTRSVSSAAIAHNILEEAHLLAQAKPSIDSQHVLGVYSFAVNIQNNIPSPITMREIIRAKHAPTIKPNGLTEKPNWQNEYAAATPDIVPSTNNDVTGTSNNMFIGA